jgi:hypothetical protein
VDKDSDLSPEGPLRAPGNFGQELVDQLFGLTVVDRLEVGRRPRGGRIHKLPCLNHAARVEPQVDLVERAAPAAIAHHDLPRKTAAAPVNRESGRVQVDHPAREGIKVFLSE